MALEVNDSNFKEVISSSSIPVVIDFWAEWCGPCRMIGPEVEALAEEYKDRAIVGKCNVDDSPNVAAEFGIRNIPTLLFFKGGEVVDKQVGAAKKATLSEKLAKLL